MDFTNNSPPDGVTLKNNEDGTTNPKYIDLLDEDKPVAGQKFVCLSFVSPEHILKQKEMFFFEQFIKAWDFNKSMEKFTQFINFISYKYNIDFEKLTNDLQQFTKDEKENLIKTTIEDDYKTFLDQQEEKIEKEFGEKHGFQTSIRGIKVRGSFPTQQEAELRCKMLRQIDPNHDVYVGPVGIWVPFHPDAYKTGRVEYMEETLNELMSEKKKNEDVAKDDFDKRVRETKENAIAENKKLAEKSGNKLTQDINEKGELVSTNLSGIENKVGNEATQDDIKKHLFESDNIVMEKNGDHGLSQLTENQKAVEEK